MMAISKSVMRKDSDALLMQEEQLSSHAKTLLTYLRELPKGQKAKVRALMLESADNPSRMRAALVALKTHPAIVFDAMGQVFFEHATVSAPVVDAPVVENHCKHDAHRVITQSPKDDAKTVKSQQLNDWLASRATRHGALGLSAGGRQSLGLSEFGTV